MRLGLGMALDTVLNPVSPIVLAAIAGAVTCAGTAAPALGAFAAGAVTCAGTANGRLWNPGDGLGAEAAAISWGTAAELALGAGASVTSWGHTNVLLAAANSPTYETAGWNGLPSVVANGSLQRMHLTAAAIAVANGNNVAWSAVYAGQMVTGAAAKEFITFDSSSSATPFVFLGTDATTHFGVLKHGDSGSTVAATFNATAFDTSAHVFSVIHAGTTVSDWIDGTAKDSAAAQNTGATTLDGCTLFGALLGGGFSRATNARLHSFGLYNYGISTALRQMTEAWAAL